MTHPTGNSDPALTAAQADSLRSQIALACGCREMHVYIDACLLACPLLPPEKLRKHVTSAADTT